MNCRTRNGDTVTVSGGQERILSFLYGTAPGRLLVKPLTAPWISRLAGAFLSTGASRFLIRPFIRKHNIDMTQFEAVDFPSYNAFFSRRIREGARPIDPDPKNLISPCDSKLTALPITEDCRFRLKQTEYSVASLLKDPALARAFLGGYALIFRLTVDDYHRYCHIADGVREDYRRIPGVLHTVNPIANDCFPIYKENAREFTVLHTDVFGDVAVMEVGALLVGKIVNHPGQATVRRGEEKGYFRFGGSTVVVLLRKGAAEIDPDILENSRMETETVVRMGEKIGTAP